MTKAKPISFAWRKLIPATFDAKGVQDAIQAKTAILRGSDVTPEQRSIALFDPALQSLASLDRGLLAERSLVLDARWIPTSKAELSVLCRQMIDRGQNQQHIDLMTEKLPGGSTLEEHIQQLWLLREKSPTLFADIVQGYLGEAINRFKSLSLPFLTTSQFKGIISRHALLWSAADVQHSLALSKVLVERPAGKFVHTNVKQVKVSSILRLMKATINVLDALFTYSERKRAGLISKKQARPRGLAWAIHRHFSARLRRSISQTGVIGALRQFAKGSDSAVAYMRPSLEQYRQQTAEIEAQDDHRDFHQIEMSDLTDITAASLSLLRYAQAEQQIEWMVDQAFGSQSASTFRPLAPLASPKIDGSVKTDPLCLRALDLLTSARCVQTQDRNIRTRTPGPYRFIDFRDKDDFAGLGCLQKALAFLQEVGPKRSSAHLSDHQRTFSRLDVLPEKRLNLAR